MKTCETCAHWQPEKGYERLKDIGNCKMVIMFWDTTEWSKEGYLVTKEEYKNQKAYVQDGSDYHASLHTRKDFGCSEHKEKNT